MTTPDFTRIQNTKAEGGGITLQLVIQPTAAAMGTFTRGLLDFEVPNRQIGIQLYGWTMKNFNSSGSMQSPVWAPLSEKTQRRKAKQGYSSKPLIRKGNLRNSFAPFSDKNIAGVGARASFGVDYARVHQEGAPSRNIPARGMLPPVEYARTSSIKIYDLHVQTCRRKAGL